MYARVNEITGTGKQLDESLRDAESVAERVDAIPGSLGMYYLIDRQAGKALAITLWETEEALRASETAAADLRDETTHDEGTVIAGVGRYEIAVNTARMPAMHT